MTATPVIVYYDGQCPLCSREIAHYRDRAKGAPVSFVDISTPDFDAAGQGVDLGLARQMLHVRVGEEIRTGIDAAIGMWEAVPGYRWLARLTRLPGIYWLAHVGYRIFARFPRLRCGHVPSARRARRPMTAPSYPAAPRGAKPVAGTNQTAP
jgi:predicted DCC family thiol-disulfide oxidoreductase YuxK